jgi:VWFA-related protein
MRRVFLALLILGCTVLIAGLVTAQQQAPKKMTMEVSLVATLDNAPVEDLKVEDITAKDNNKKQEIVSFEKVVAGAPAKPGKPGLYNIVLLDCLNTTYRDLPENRAEFLRILFELSKADKLTFLSLWQKLRVVEDPGMQPPTLMSKLASQGPQGLAGDQPNLEPYNWVFSDQLGMYQLFTPSGVLGVRRTEESMIALRTIALNYQSRPGRKNLIWISQGFPVIAGQTMGGLAIYPIDVRYLSTTDTQSADRADMQTVAKESGGLAFQSRRDVANCVREALNDTRTSYVLEYALPDFKYDGASHAIKIDTTRKDVKLRYRSEYIAPTKAPK